MNISTAKLAKTSLIIGLLIFCKISYAGKVSKAFEALQVYNYATKDVRCNINFDRVGGETDILKLTYSSANRDIPVGMVGEWKVNVNVQKTATSEAHIYTSNINCGEFSKQYDLVVTVQ